MAGAPRVALTAADDGPILLFDGSCGVCGWAVGFTLRHDRAGRFRFTSLESSVGRELLQRHGVGGTDSVVLIDRGRAWLRSDAVLGILRRLGGWWHLLRVIAIVPRGVRDLAYDVVARNRQRISARLGLTCHLPSSAERGRFLG